MQATCGAGGGTLRAVRRTSAGAVQDESRRAVASQRGAVWGLAGRLFPRATGAAPGHAAHLVGHTGPIDDVAFSSGHTLASASDDHTIRMWIWRLCAATVSADSVCRSGR
ncbi:WD40 repeat domain-containing protein [Streptomyces sp. NPDC004533]|uniref:WD40 repeat domain-containing protein n=1 Tax=unclassified Streptomyces TaxID=2593676 RepID=UPI0033AE83A3